MTLEGRSQDAVGMAPLGRRRLEDGAGGRRREDDAGAMTLEGRRRDAVETTTRGWRRVAGVIPCRSPGAFWRRPLASFMANEATGDRPMRRLAAVMPPQISADDGLPAAFC